MTPYEIKASVAAYLEKSTTDLTVNGVDLGRQAINQVRLNAELAHDFNFSKKLVTVSVDSVVGGSLDSAVLFGTTTPASIKSIIDVGTFGQDTGAFYPADWETVESSLITQRQENPFSVPRYPTDSQAETGPCGTRRFIFSGDTVFFYPQAVEPFVVTLGIWAYTWHPDWTDDDFRNGANVSSPWLDRGHQYLHWQAVHHLNYLFKQFVPRQEGNLASPKELADSALDKLISWDVFKYEQFRTHDR